MPVGVRRGEEGESIAQAEGEGESTALEEGEGESTALEEGEGESTALEEGEGESNALEEGEGESNALEEGEGESTALVHNLEPTHRRPTALRCPHCGYHCYGSCECFRQLCSSQWGHSPHRYRHLHCVCCARVFDINTDV
jgi:hypothetical protein